MSIVSCRFGFSGPGLTPRKDLPETRPDRKTAEPSKVRRLHSRLVGPAWMGTATGKHVRREGLPSSKRTFSIQDLNLHNH